MINTTPTNNLYPVANATTSSDPFVDVFMTRDPTPNDVQYPTQKKWLNTTNNNFWMLEGFTSAGGVVQAIWIKIGGGAVVEVFTVDASTSPGTNPVTPNAGNITVTGGQVAAGTTAHVIRTDSLAANTYTIEVQRSQAVASSTIGDNGVSHFNSAQFTVDANGFVSAAGAIATTYTENTGTATPSANNLNVLGASGITTSGSGSTITISPGGTIATTYTEDTGTATPSGNNLNIVGGTAITTSGSGSTVTINAAGTVATTYDCNTGTATPSGNVLNVVGGGGTTTSGSGNTITVTSTGSGTGSIVQAITTISSSIVSGNNTMPIATVPQNTNGSQILSATITPTSSLSTLLIQANVVGWGNNGNNMGIIALFQDATANALATQPTPRDATAGNTNAVLTFSMAAGTTSATTFKIRGGAPSSATGTDTFVMNTYDGTNTSGGTLFSTLTIFEIHA